MKRMKIIEEISKKIIFFENYIIGTGMKRSKRWKENYERKFLTRETKEIDKDEKDRQRIFLFGKLYIIRIGTQRRS